MKISVQFLSLYYMYEYEETGGDEIKEKILLDKQQHRQKTVERVDFRFNDHNGDLSRDTQATFITNPETD